MIEIGRDDREGEPSFAGISTTSVHNQSVLKAVALIGCFVDSPEAKSLTELARRTGMNVSTAYRMLQTLVRTGVLRRSGDTDRYSVGPLLLALASSTFSGVGFSTATEILETLAARTGESVSLGVRDDGCVAVLLAVRSPHQLRFEHRAGARVPMHCSAMGKALLAFGDAPFAAMVTGLGVLARLTPRSVVEPDRLVADLQETVRRGYAVADEEQHLGVRSIAVALPGGQRGASAALGIQGPCGRLTDLRVAEVLGPLREAASAMARLPLVGRLSG